MAQAARQRVPLTDNHNWLRLDDAAAQTGESIRTWRWRAEREQASAVNSRRSALAVKDTADGKGNPVWWVHRDFDPRLSRYPTTNTREQQARQGLLERFSEPQVTGACVKTRWLDAWRKAYLQRGDPAVTKAEVAEGIIAEAKRIEGDDFAISFRSLQLWERAYYTKSPNGQIRGVEGLIDRRGNATPSSSSPTGRSAEAVEYFYMLYHTQNLHTIRACHETTLRKVKREGWAWPVSYSATRKWLQTHDDLAISYLMRQGKAAFARRYLPHLEVDYSQLQPDELYVCDHTQCDFWIEHRGEQLRPWQTAIVDSKSRCVVGWNLGVSPHQDAILSAMRMAFRDWAIPTSMRIDNGKDFTSELLTGVTKRTRDRLRKEHGRDWQRILKRDADLVDCVDPRWTGIINELGVELIYAIPYSPQCSP